MINKEEIYTSTNTKLLHNLDRLQEIQQGSFRPISIQLAPTDKCNLNCNMCSVKKREGNELTLDECCKILKDFRDLGAKSVEFTGGGDSTMHPDINGIIKCASDLGYDIGLITNGVKLSNIAFSNLEKLTWVRISLNCLDYVDDISVYLPKSVTLGFSYVYTNLSSREKLDKVKEYYYKYNAKYVRVVPDCTSVSTINDGKASISSLIEDYPEFFFQSKHYNVYDKCWIYLLKPFINSDGYVYTCSAIPLISNKFDRKFAVCKATDAKVFWNQPPKAFPTHNCEEGKCFFSAQNQLLDQVILPCEHSNFV